MARHLITSALPYINGIKHLGNLIGSILPADVFAKYLRQNGHETLYICGTDEHGAPAEIAAKEAGLEIGEYCAKMYETQKAIYQQFDIEFDYFGRSSSRANHNITQEIYSKLKENGFIEERSIKQYYSIDDARFLPDRYIEGTCPKCGFEGARGDQCDGCGSLLDPTDLIAPYSAISKSNNLKLIDTKHLFLRLDLMQNDLKDFVDNRAEWPDLVKSIAYKWLKEGLTARCITRDLEWGVSVPEPGFEGKVFYVWFDAPNGYISITADWARSIGQNDAWKDWWFAGDDVQYTQFMAKDNVPFHSIFWPAMLLGCRSNYKQVDIIKGFNWLTYEKGKFSTSRKRGIFTDRALELFPSDYWRYYLLANCPESSDSDFNFPHFASTINKDLADVLGNFANRCLALVHKYFNGQVPSDLNESNLNMELKAKLSEQLSELDAALMSNKFRQATQIMRSCWVIANEYITEAAPWEAVKSDLPKAAVILSHCLWMLKFFAVIGHPFIPQTSKTILELLNMNLDLRNSSFRESLDCDVIKVGHQLSEPRRLFAKIDDDAVAKLVEEFAGKAE